jgi:hypothetical protein
MLGLVLKTQRNGWSRRGQLQVSEVGSHSDQGGNALKTADEDPQARASSVIRAAAATANVARAGPAGRGSFAGLTRRS